MLQKLLHNVPIKSITGNPTVAVKHITNSSKNILPDSLFFAVPGTKVDGHNFIDDVIKAGATVVVLQKLPSNLQSHVTYVEVDDVAKALAQIAANFYNNPSEKLTLVGVTGTNGKTTVATILYKLFEELGYTCGLISSVENKIGTDTLESTHTTPDAITLNALLNAMVEAKCNYVFMECSSHAIAQSRIAALHFKVAIFTNITHDHLDYHKTFDAYIDVKKSWFDSLPKSSIAITNIDDKRGKVMVQNTKAKKVTYSLETSADYRGRIIEDSFEGLLMSINSSPEVHFRMVGTFNAYNIVAVYATALELGQPSDEVLAKLSNISGAKGRFDYKVSNKKNIVTIVDYAHTPDALVNVLSTIEKLNTKNKNIITVIGCGGNRDKTKRPIMGKVASKYSNHAYFTADNPRTERAEDIIKSMETDLTNNELKKVSNVVDRKEAITAAIKRAQVGDIILVAGKGNETYQDIDGIKYPFDDRVVIDEVIKQQES